MAKTRSITSIDAEISKVKQDLIKTQEKQDALAEKLRDLQKEKSDYEAKLIVDAYVKSGKSFEEIMNFLQP